MFHGWRFDPEGDQAAADSTRSSTSLDTGSLVKPRTARRLVTASYTSMIAYLPPVIAARIMKHRGTNGNEFSLHCRLLCSSPEADRGSKAAICPSVCQPICPPESP